MYDKWIVGTGGFMAYTDGTPEGGGIISSGTALDFQAIHGINADHILAVGMDGLMQVYRGESWQQIGCPPIKNWTSVWCVATDHMWMFGS